VPDGGEHGSRDREDSFLWAACWFALNPAPGLSTGSD
jgi:hypothetical protein